MATSKIIVDHLSKKHVVIPPQNTFYRRISPANWDDLSIGVVLGATTTTDDNVSPPTQSVTYTSERNYPFVCIRDSRDTLAVPGEDGFSGAGIRGNGNGGAAGFQAFADATRLSYFSKFASVDTGIEVGLTTTTGYFMHGSSYSSYWLTALRFKKNEAGGNIGVAAATGSLSALSITSPLTHEKIELALANITQLNDANLSWLAFNYAAAGALDTFCAYLPFPNARLKLYGIVIKKNA